MNDFGREFLSLDMTGTTEVITFGPSLFEISKLENMPHTMILMIPGNPGVIKYYEEFMRTLYKSLDMSCPVWGISHAGHAKEPEDLSTNQASISGKTQGYTLEGQIKHKKFFIRDFIPASIKLILIGHSIGAYMALELLNILPRQQVTKAILLFPTIERMALSPNGKWAVPLVNYFTFLPTFFAHIGSFVSKDFKSRVIRWYLKGMDIPECAINASLDVCEPSVAKSSIMLAKDEMEKVVDANSATILANQDKLIFYYGASDNWCPVAYYQDTRDRFPNVDARLCEMGCAHAFVLESSQQMGEQVSGWIKDEILKA